MKKVVSVFLALAAVLVIGSTSAKAEDGMFGPVKIGVQGSLASDDVGFGIGARVEYSLEEMIGMPISAAASFDFFFPDGPDTWMEFNVNALYSVPMDMFVPYAGVGFHYISISFDNPYGDDSDSEMGLNLIAGSKFDLGMAFTPFVEGRLLISDAEDFVITAGILF